MRGLFGSIVGKLAAATPLASALHAHFGHLDKTESGLARKLTNYVRTGSGGSVLSTIAAPAVAAAWRSRGVSYPRRTPADLMLAADDTNEALLRFGEVLAVLEPNPQNSHWGVFGTALTPDWLRHALSSHDSNERPICDTARIEKLALLGGASPVVVMDILLHPGPGVNYRTQNSLDRFSGASLWLADHVATITEHHAKLDAVARVGLTQAIGRFGLVESYLPVLIDYGIASAKTVRSEAVKALTAAPQEMLAPLLTTQYAAAKPATRTELVALAAGALGPGAGRLLEQWREKETDKRPLAAIERALGNLALNEETKPAAISDLDGYTALDGSSVTFPPRTALPAPSRIPDDAFDLLRPTIDSFNERVRIVGEEHKKAKNQWDFGHSAITSGDLHEFRKSLETSEKPAGRRGNREGMNQLHWGWSANYLKFDRSGLVAFYSHPALTIRHLMAALRDQRDFLILLGDGFDHAAGRALRQRLTGSVDIRAAIDLWVEKGGKAPVAEYLEQEWRPSIAHIDPKLLWPYVAESFDAIDEAMGLRPQSRQERFHAANALDLLNVLPKVPQRYFLPLMMIATGSQKTLRQRARTLLAGAPRIDEAIEGLLQDRQHEVRAGAAEWLAARSARASVPALRRALDKEKSEVVRAAIITARERLGDDVSDCFDAERLLAEAGAGLGKTSLKGLEWFPFDLLPRLAWQDGKPVAPQIVKWWVALAHKLKQPGGNALLDLWLDRLKPEDAQKLGLLVLRSWIDHDTRRPSDDEANAHALAHVDAVLQQNRQMVKQYPQTAEYYVTDRDKLFAGLKREKLAQYFGSAADCKGVLALAGRAPGADAASAVRAFFKDHGSRVSQDKALLDMLAANPAAAAIQVVLATANRFKARTVQEYAVTLIERIAQRRGWTPDELADRTIPTAGLDERGEAEIDCGTERVYRLVLDEHNALVLFNAAGQMVKALPTARNDAERPLIAAAKTFLANARKELKQTSDAQAERLYEAMCLQRRWKADDWEQQLLCHPIIGRLVRRIVWIGLDRDGARVTLFRPLDDGSLSDVRDATVSLAKFAEVQIAHANILAPVEVQAWNAHLADYEVASLFAQLDQDLPQLSDKDRSATTIEDRKGWMIENFKLRGAATKHGFVRGAAEDGGVFMTYERRYNSAGLVAVIDFSGSPLPEQNVPTALHGLRFPRLQRGATWYGEGIPLKDVPPVLLSESWKAFHRIAAAGTGYDPDWEKKALW